LEGPTPGHAPDPRFAGRPTAPALQNHRGATQCFALPAPLAVALRSLARREDVTLFMLLLAAFQTLLHRYSGQEDFLIGSPIADARASRPKV